MRRRDGARIDEQDALPPANNGRVEVAEDNDLAVRKLRRQSLIEEVEGGGIVPAGDVLVLQGRVLVACLLYTSPSPRD